MSRVEELKKNIDNRNRTVDEIYKADIELSSETIININLATIAETLADISVTLAMIAENTQRDAQESEG